MTQLRSKFIIQQLEIEKMGKIQPKRRKLFKKEKKKKVNMVVVV